MKQQGFSLIELVVFIVVISVAMVGIILSFNTVLSHSAKPGQNLIASQLADIQMNIMLLQRHLNGFSNITNPCNTSNNACAALNNFANNAGYTIETTVTNPTSNTALVTVNVTGTANATAVLEFFK